VKMNRRRWFARAASCASAGSTFEFQLAGQSPTALQFPARSDFPIAETAAFLNNAAWHPLSTGALGAIQTYLQRKSTGSTRFSFAPTGDQVKALLAKLIHAQHSSIGFVPSTTVGENLVVAGLGFPRSQGNIVTDALHYENSTYLYRSLQAQGLDVRFVMPREGRIELADLEKAINDDDRVATIAVDLTADDGPQRIVDLAVERWGHIDFLINNAGVGSPKPLHETDDESLDYFLGLMLRAPFRLARDVIPHMQPGSAIINVTSTFAVIGGLRGGAYSAAKGGMTALTTHIACQYGPQGIRCNAVAPGVTLTPMVVQRLEDERFRKINTEMTPYPRLGRVDDLASTVAFLCSEGGSFINGQTIAVDGGWSSTKYLSEFALTSEWIAR